MGREIRVRVVPLEAWAERARASGLSDDRVACLTEMFRYYERHGFRGNSRVLAWLLGRQPTAFEDFARRAAAQS